MRIPKAISMAAFLWSLTFAFSQESDEALMARTRAAYDTPFTRNLAEFDCAVQFDWKQHYIQNFGALPPSSEPLWGQLQPVHHRVSLNHTAAKMISIPARPDFSASPNRAQIDQLEQVYDAMVSSGLNAWMPSAAGLILPVGDTKYSFEKSDSQFKLTMTGQNVSGTLLMDQDLRVLGGIMSKPDPLRFSTEFDSSPMGYVLTKVRTSPSLDGNQGDEATFSYAYQTVEGIQIPQSVSITAANGTTWNFTLDDCKVAKFVKIQNLPMATGTH